MRAKNRIIALTMAGIMCVSLAGCGKESKKKEKVDQYNAVQQKVIEHSVSEMTVLNEALYGIYTDYNEESAEVKSGLIKYDFNSKEVTEKDTNTEGNMYIDSVSVNAEGQLVLSGMKYFESKDNDESYTYSNVKYIYDTDLNQVSFDESEPITESVNEESVNGDREIVYGSVKTNDGTTVTLYLHMMEDECSVKITDSEGKEKSSFKLENMANGIYCLDGKKVLCDIYEDDSQFLYEVDLENGKLGKQIVDVSKYLVNNMYAGTNDKMMFTSSTSLYECDCNTGKVKKVLNFIDSDINSQNVKYIFTLSDGTLGIVIGNNAETQIEIDYLYKQDKNEKAKTELTVGVLTLDSDLQEEIIQYNKTHDDVRLVVKEYYGEDEDDYDKALSKFNSDIASGNCPDIINFGSEVAELSEYAEKGIIEELTPYFEKDKDIHLEDLVQSVVETYKINGKLYVLPETFTVNGLFGASSVVGKETGWTLDEFLEFAKSFPNGTEVMPYPTREGALEALCTYNLNRYVDWSTGECSFDKGDFAKILEFSNTLMNAEDYWKEWEAQNGQVSEVTKIREKQQILYGGYMYSVEDYLVAKAIYGEDITFKGYPASEGNGVVVDSASMSLCAISAKSKHKDEAWEFIRQSYLPAEENGNNNNNYYGTCFPIRQDELDTMLEDAKTPQTYIDENGNEQIAENVWSFDNIELTVPVATDEDIAVVKNIIHSIDTLGGSNSMIEEIINEEAEAFYNGQKSAEEVAKIVQSRVSVYVKENR